MFAGIRPTGYVGRVDHEKCGDSRRAEVVAALAAAAQAPAICVGRSGLS